MLTIPCLSVEEIDMLTDGLRMLAYDLEQRVLNSGGSRREVLAKTDPVDTLMDRLANAKATR